MSGRLEPVQTKAAGGKVSILPRARSTTWAAGCAQDMKWDGSGNEFLKSFWTRAGSEA